MGLIFSGQDLSNWGITVDSSKTWVKPERDREFIHVPGRSGDLIIDRGAWFNVNIEYACHIQDDFDVKFDSFIKWISHFKNYEMLVDDKHPGVYRLATVEIHDCDPKTVFTTKSADFTLVFNCKPQQFINDGVNHDIELDFTEQNDGATINPVGTELWGGTPLVYVFAPGGAFFTIENSDGLWSFDIAPFQGDRLVIDFETGNAVVRDEMDEFIENGNEYVTVTPPSVYAPDFPSSNGQIIAYHTTGDDDPVDPDVEDDMNEGEGEGESGATYTGTLLLDPRFWRI